ncbi:helix-turn-helix transcriptional regulator [Streptomyces triticirhizae]|nr:helix-turn-helix transcriptional regulator [Streptomyces triticirhizae]
MAKRDELRRKELADFLRSRRRRVDPSVTGLPLASSGRRRMPGLRREEVAQISGVSLTWYTWLEQGRDINASEQVLNSIAKALRLSPVEQAHLFRLAGEKAKGPAAVETESPLHVQELLDLLNPNPAYAINRFFDILAWNRAEEALLHLTLAELPKAQRNVIWLLFNDPRARDLLPDWESEARWLVGILRAESAHQPGAPRLIELVDELRAGFPEFERLWRSHELGSFTPAERRFNHPKVGSMRLLFMKLAVEGSEGCSVVTHFAAPDSPERELLARLVATSPTGGDAHLGPPS